MADEVDEIKQKIDIVSLLGSYIDIKKAGRNYKALCPFHSEKSPSFMISPELQIYKCFGCNESGDIFSFVQKYEGMDFPESLKYLADKAGVKLESSSYKADSLNARLFEVNLLAAKFYNYILTSHKSGGLALDYLLQKRKIANNTLKTFNIGYSPDHPTALVNFLITKKRFDRKALEDSGIFYLKNGQLVDRFRGRAVFPLYDHRGNIVGFSGRILPWDEKRDLAKYINSPETQIYHKSKVLYGLNLTKQDIKNEGTAVIVEGELDAISTYQAGIKNVVAIKGSALTDEQARLLYRFTPRLVLALDQDTAGGAATARGIKIAESVGLEIAVATLGKYKDPDEMATHDPDGLKKSVNSAIAIWDFLIDLIFKKYTSENSQSTAKLSKEVVPVLASIEDTIVQAKYIELAAKKLAVPYQAVETQVSKFKTKIGPNSPEKETEEIEVKRRDVLENKLLALAFVHNPNFLQNDDVTKLLKDQFSKKLYEQFSQFMKLNKKFDLAHFSKSLPSELFQGYSELILKASDIGSDEDDNNGLITKELDMVVKELDILNTKENLNELEGKIRLYEKQKDKINLSRAKANFSELTKHLTGLKMVGFRV